jgi:hypothetical protein
MKRPQQELSISVWVDFGRILAPKPVAGVLGSTVLFVCTICQTLYLLYINYVLLQLIYPCMTHNDFKLKKQTPGDQFLNEIPLHLSFQGWYPP